jgi:hypothetical protein
MPHPITTLKEIMNITALFKGAASHGYPLSVWTSKNPVRWWVGSEEDFAGIIEGLSPAELNSLFDDKTIIYIGNNPLFKKGRRLIS